MDRWKVNGAWEAAGVWDAAGIVWGSDAGDVDGGAGAARRVGTVVPGRGGATGEPPGGVDWMHLQATPPPGFELASAARSALR